MRGEATRLMSLTGLHICKVVGVCLQSPHIGIGYEYLDSRSLEDVLLDKTIDLSMEARVKIALDMCKGVEELHSQGVVHQYLHSKNVLVSPNLSAARVTDYGFSGVKDDARTMTATFLPAWTAPDAFDGQFSQRADVYAIGVLLWQMVSRQLPFSGLHYMQVASMVQEGVRPVVPSSCPEWLTGLIEECWDGTPEFRPDIGEIISVLELNSTSSNNSIAE